MSDLIRREDAIHILACEMYAEAQAEGYEVGSVEDYIPEAKAWMSDAPSAEAVHGEWVNRSMNIRYPEWERYTCSVCGKHSYLYDFCPNCGARMRGEEE